MNDFFELHRTRSWLLLIAGTLATWGMGIAGLAGTGITVTILAIAFFKGRLVILDFMELRQAPLFWRLILEGWLIAVSALILLAYWMSLK
jgi:hypothetical protein